MEDNKTTILEGFTLPSKGLIYNKNINPNIKLRSMTVRDEMKRQSPSDRPYNKMASMIEDCIIGEKLPISVYDMSIGDYEYLLHKLRIVSYGPNYKMMVICPNCNKVINDEINLDELKIRDFDEKDFNDSLNIHLDGCNKDITLNFQTPRILDEIDIKAKELKKKTPNSNIDFTLISTLLYAIDTVDGIALSYTEKYTFVENLQVRDMNKIINRINLVNRKVGLDTDNIVIKCKECNYEVNTFFRYNTEFFRPTND